jgi:hypothetical protein
MGGTASMSTWDILKQFGFMPDETVSSDVRPGLSYDFGNFKLSAGCVLNLQLREIVLFTGVLTTQRTITEVIFEMPRQVESPEQSAAWIAWHVTGGTASREFKPMRETGWLELGRRHYHLLPWERQKAVYAARPRCMISRKWARLALNTLSGHLAEARETVIVEIGFDGTALTIRCKKNVVTLPAEGSPWKDKYHIHAKKIRHLPKRLMHDPVEVSVFDGAFILGNRRYPGVLNSMAVGTP